MSDSVFASFVRRVAAGALDVLCVLPFFGGAFFLFAWRSASWAIPGAAVLAVIGLVVWIGNAILLPAIHGQTIGDRVSGIRVVLIDRPQNGAGIGGYAAVVRAFAQTGISPIFFLGFLWVIIDDRLHRGWHDVCAGTMMVRATETGALLLPRHRGREIVSLVYGVVGTLVLLSPVLMILFVQLLAFVSDASVVRIAPTAGTVASTTTLAAIPADFPSAIVIPAAEHIREVLSSMPTAETRRVVVVWRDLPAEPVSTMLAYNTSFSLLGFTTTMEYLADGPHLHFANAEGTTRGEVTMVPTDDTKRVRELRMVVSYPRGK